MKLLRSGFLALAFVAPVLAAAPTIDDFFESLALEWVRGNPQAATAQQAFQGAEQDALDRRLTPVSDAYQDERTALARRGLAELHKFDRAALTPAQRVSRDILEWQLDDRIRGAAFRDYSFPFRQMNGVQQNLPDFLTNIHPIRNSRDVENYLARLEQVGPLIDASILNARNREKKGILPPRFILTATIDQIERFLAPAPRRNTLVVSLEERAAKIAALPSDERAKFVAQAEKLVQDSVYPAYRRAAALLRGQLPRATDDAGIWRLPGGEAAYAYALHTQTTTVLTPDQVHELGRKEVARIEQEMDALLRNLDLTEGTVEERMRRLNAQSSYPDEPEVRAKILADYDGIIRDAERRCAALFDLRPKAAVIVQRESEFAEKNASANYSMPARDGSRPGIFRVPLPGPQFVRAADMRTTAYHETVPGHHIQLALQQEMTGLPRFRRDGSFGGSTAYVEGWALYAERLAAESGWYEGDPKGRLGQLAMELFRARRLVVDTGLHTQHWTRQQAIDYGIPVSEVERYVVWPGQACAYLIGELKILGLREKARQALGAKFSLKEFHNTILRSGGMPLALLEQVVDEYIQASR